MLPSKKKWAPILTNPKMRNREGKQIQNNFEIVTQVRAIACTDILVGVEGAGLEWSHFMKKGKALLELAWPEKHWNFFYSCK